MGGSKYLHSSEFKPLGIWSLKVVRRYYKDTKGMCSIFTSGFESCDTELSCCSITETLLNIRGPRKQAANKLTSLFDPK